jgi:hypothetical protein
VFVFDAVQSVTAMTVALNAVIAGGVDLSTIGSAMLASLIYVASLRSIKV